MIRRSHTSYRTCVGCGARDAQANLVRLQPMHGAEPGCEEAPGQQPVVITVVDKPGPGRSAYLHSRKGCVDRIGKARALGRSLRLRFGKEDLGRLSTELLATGRFSDDAGLDDRA